MTTTPPSDHPTPQQLQDFELGKLDEERSAGIESHLEICDSCNDYLNHLSQTDKLVDFVRELENDRTSYSQPESGAGESCSVTPTVVLTKHGVAKFKDAPHIPGYALLEELGQGGMGVVYQARHTQLNRFVAIKLLVHYKEGDRDALQRFQKEAEALALLKHPNIVQIYEVDFGHDPPFLAIEYVPGKDLSRRLADGTMTPQEAARLVEQLARAMHTAHLAGIVHRDLKPSNVLLDGDDGIPKITDFGLARRLEATTQLTREGSVMGTPSYMAPEQADPLNNKIGTSCDVYALGSILYECLTGRPPFKAPDPVTTLLQVIHVSPVSPSQLQPKLPPDVETICLKCLEKDPHRRYWTAEELADDLKRFVNGEPISARPIGALERSWRWIRRHPSQTGFLAAALVALLAVVGVGVGLVYQGQLQTANNQLASANHKLEVALGEAETARTVAEKARDAEAHAKGALDQMLYLRQVSLALAEYNDNEIVRARKRLAECPEARRHWEWHYVHHLCYPELLTIEKHADWVNTVAYAPDGKHFASGSNDKTTRIWDTNTGQEIAVLKGHTKGIIKVVYSPDGKHLVDTSFDGTAKIWNVTTAKEIMTLKGVPIGRKGELTLNSVVYSPHGKRLIGTGYGRVKIWDADTGRELLTFKTHYARAVACSPDGKQLATAGNDKTIRIWDAATGKELKTLKGHTGVVYDVAYSPDGKSLASASYDKTVKIWQAATGLQIHTLMGHTGSVYRLVFSPDSKCLASASADKRIKIWDVTRGQEISTLMGHAKAVYDVAYSPDGKHLVSTSFDKTVKTWPVVTNHDQLIDNGFDWFGGRATPFSPDRKRRANVFRHRRDWIKVADTVSGRQIFKFKGHRGGVSCVTYSPDGTDLASSGWDKTVRIWDAATGRPIHALKGHTKLVTYVAYSPDGKLLASASADGTVKIWDAASRRELYTFKGHKKLIHSVAFSRDSKRLASASYEKTVKLWDLITGKELCTLRGHNSMVSCVAFDATGKLLASSGADAIIILWDTKKGTLLHHLKGHLSSVRNLAFSADSNRLATTSSDRTMRVWDTVTGHEALTIKEYSAQFGRFYLFRVN